MAHSVSARMRAAFIQRPHLEPPILHRKANDCTRKKAGPECRRDRLYATLQRRLDTLRELSLLHRGAAFARRENDDLGADIDAAVEVGDACVGQPDTARPDAAAGG